MSSLVTWFQILLDPLATLLRQYGKDPPKRIPSTAWSKGHIVDQRNWVSSSFQSSTCPDQWNEEIVRLPALIKDRKMCSKQFVRKMTDIIDCVCL